MANAGAEAAKLDHGLLFAIHFSLLGSAAKAEQASGRRVLDE
jgi:hypothetical protein